MYVKLITSQRRVVFKIQCMCMCVRVCVRACVYVCLHGSNSCTWTLMYKKTI